MGTSIFPALKGLGWEVGRSPIWSTTQQQNISGKEVRIALQTYPRWQWNLTFDVLRQGTINGNTYAEFSQLSGFFNARQGSFDSFLYTDNTDNSVTTQTIASGDGSTKTFQLVRTFGGFIEPVLAPNAVSHVYLNGTNQASGWSVSNWGSATPGVLTFTTAPGSGVAITADFTYYWPCRFVDDKLVFSNFMASLWSGKQVNIISVKN